MPSTRRVVCVIESRMSATAPNVSGAGTAGQVGVCLGGGLALEVDELREHGHPADAVGDRVVHLHRRARRDRLRALRTA